MAARDNRARARLFFEEVMSGQKPESLETHVIRDYVEHEELEGVPSGIEGLRQKLAQLHSAFPDLRFTVEDTVAEGDKIVEHWGVADTHTMLDQLGVLHGWAQATR